MNLKFFFFNDIYLFNLLINLPDLEQNAAGIATIVVYPFKEGKKERTTNSILQYAEAFETGNTVQF